jgi:hypothetical protein
MGQEARCTIRVGDRTSAGKALLETDELVFRGDDGLRLKVPFKSMRSVEGRDGELRVETPDGRAVFELGAQAERWAQKILNPPSLLDKLGVKAGMRVLVLGVEDEGFLADLWERTDGVVLGEGSAAGLVDVKVVRFSDTHTASKFVIRKAARGR